MEADFGFLFFIFGRFWIDLIVNFKEFEFQNLDFDSSLKFLPKVSTRKKGNSEKLLRVPHHFDQCNSKEGKILY